MEAAINNAAVVYHSDPRLILRWCLLASQPASQEGISFHPLFRSCARRDQPTP